MVSGIVQVLDKATTGALEVYQKQLRDKYLWPGKAGRLYTANTVCESVQIVFQSPPLTIDSVLREILHFNPSFSGLRDHMKQPHRDPRWLEMYHFMRDNEAALGVRTVDHKR